MHGESEQVGGRHLDEGGRLVQRHLSRGNVQPEPGRFLPLQAAGALAPRFSHVPCGALGLPAEEGEEERESKVQVVSSLLFQPSKKSISLHDA